MKSTLPLLSIILITWFIIIQTILILTNRAIPFEHFFNALQSFFIIATLIYSVVSNVSQEKRHQEIMQFQNRLMISEGYIKTEVDSWLIFRKLILECNEPSKRYGIAILLDSSKIDFYSKHPLSLSNELKNSYGELLHKYSASKIFFDKGLSDEEMSIIKIQKEIFDLLYMNLSSGINEGRLHVNCINSDVFNQKMYDYAGIQGMIDLTLARQFLNNYYDEAVQLKFIPAYNTREITDTDVSSIINDTNQISKIRNIFIERFFKKMDLLQASVDEYILSQKDFFLSK